MYYVHVWFPVKTTLNREIARSNAKFLKLQVIYVVNHDDEQILIETIVFSSQCWKILIVHCF